MNTNEIPDFDLYRELEVDASASGETIEAAFRSLMRRNHPDVASNRAAALARAKRLNVARDWLVDPERRAEYDAHRQASRPMSGRRRREGGPPTNGHPRDSAANNPPANRRRTAPRGPQRSLAESTGEKRPLALLLAGVALFAVVVIAVAFLLPGVTGSSTSPGTTPDGSSPAGASLSDGASASGAVKACPTSQPAPLPAGQKRTVTIETPKGAIVITVDGTLSPIAAGNFVALASCGFYNDVVFHRVVPGFVVQGGDGQYGKASNLDRQLVGSGGPGYTIQDEPVTATYGRGTVAMARTQAPNSQGSQFFIVLDDSARGALAQFNTYAIFGTVTKGMDTVDAIAKAADAQNPSNPVPMTKVTVSNP